MIETLLETLDRLGSATVEELVVALRQDVERVRYVILEVLDLGKIAVDHARPEAYRRVTD